MLGFNFEQQLQPTRALQANAEKPKTLSPRQIEELIKIMIRFFCSYDFFDKKILDAFYNKKSINGR
jgi:hypothetical protein